MQSNFFITLKPDEEANISGGATRSSTSDTKEAALDGVTKYGIFYKRKGTYVFDPAKTKEIYTKGSNITLVPAYKTDNYTLGVIGKESEVSYQI